MGPIPLDDQLREYLTVNTHRGLYQPKRLQYGMKRILGQKIQSLTVRVDDILIAGINQKEMLENLRETLTVTRNCGLRLKREKCSFMVDEMIYLGFLINSKDVAPVKAKLDSILEMPTPTNETELKSFLGMVNYSQRHLLPNLAESLESLHRLLRKGSAWK